MIGSFEYDSSGTIDGFGEGSDWFFHPTSTKHFLTHWDSYYDSTIATPIVNTYWFKYQTPFVGDGEWKYMIDRVSFTAKVDSNLTITILNRDGDSLNSSGAIAMQNIANDSSFVYDVSFGAHESSYLSVEFKFRNKGDGWIGDITLYPKKVGRVVTR